ncbi:MAG: type II secretion system F family protein [Phycisphaeraceae bacterium]|nr:MAG: type II secretion system F family protein [Phycisphaeraceae bacterium]
MGGLSSVDVLAIGAVFMLVLCVTGIGGLIWLQSRSKRSEQVKRRVGMNVNKDGDDEGGRVVRLFHDGHEFEAILPGLGKRAAGPLAAIAKRCKEAGLTTPLPTLLLIAASSAVGTFVAVWVLTQNPLGATLAGAGVVYLMWTGVKMKANKKTAKFDDQFVEALDLCARSLRAGHTVIAGLGLAAEESDEPVKSVLTDIVQQQEMGVNLEQALRNVAEKSTSQDLKLFAASVAVQIKAGGNLSETTNRLSAVIRDRLRLGRRVRVLIAQTQMSKQMLLGLPVVVFVLLNVINPEYVKPMYTTDMGQTMLMMCTASMFIGAWAMSKMAVIKY